MRVWIDEEWLDRWWVLGQLGRRCDWEWERRIWWKLSLRREAAMSVSEVWVEVYMGYFSNLGYSRVRSWFGFRPGFNKTWIQPGPISGFFILFLFLTQTWPYSLSAWVNPDPLRSGRAEYPWVGHKLSFLSKSSPIHIIKI